LAVLSCSAATTRYETADVTKPDENDVDTNVYKWNNNNYNNNNNNNAPYGARISLKDESRSAGEILCFLWNP
jgi:hypothetical protein